MIVIIKEKKRKKKTTRPKQENVLFNKRYERKWEKNVKKNRKITECLINVDRREKKVFKRLKLSRNENKNSTEEVGNQLDSEEKNTQIRKKKKHS